jgi:hypothetical protein
MNFRPMTSATSQSFGDSRGSCSIARVSPNVLLMVIKGAVSAALSDQFCPALERELAAGGKSHTFWDAESLHHYDSTLRIECTRVIRENWNRVESLHVLVRSPLVRMGVAVANLALESRIQSYAERVRWQAKLDATRNVTRQRSA